MIDASSKLGRSLPNCAILVCCACTMVMNAKFGWSLGADKLEKGLYTVFSVALDVLKAFGLAFVFNALWKAHYTKAVCAAVIWIVTVVYSANAAVGFSISTRATAVSEKQHGEDYKKDQIATAKRISSELDVMRTSAMYLGTAGCSTERARMSVSAERFCYTLYLPKYGTLLELEKDLPTSYVADVDPYTTFVANLSKYPREYVSLAFAVIMAVVAELVSSVGTYAYSSSRMKSEYRRPWKTRFRKFWKSKAVATAEPARRGPGRPPGSKNKPKLAAVGGRQV
jgi:hypothetical protein